MYGWRTDDIDRVAADLERALGIELEPRDSMYWGEYYGWHGKPRGELILQKNFFDELDQELTMPEHPNYKVILHTSFLSDGWAERIAAIEGAEVLEN